MTAHMRAEFKASKGRYGAPRIYQVLKDKGIRVGRSKIGKIMQQEGLRASLKKKHFSKTLKANQGTKPAANI